MRKQCVFVLNRPYTDILRGGVWDFQADFMVGVKCHVAHFSNFFVV